MKYKEIIAVITLLLMTVQAQNWDNQGVPNNLVDDIYVSDALFHDINVILPRNRSVPKYNPRYLDEKNQKNIVLVEEAEVFITFVHEGAGFQKLLWLLHLYSR